MTDFEARSRVHALKHHVSEELERIEDELKREELLFSVIPKVVHFDRLTTQKNKNLLMKVFSKWLLILLAFDSRRSKKKR